MSHDESRVIEKIAESGEGLEPGDGWEHTVRRRIRSDTWETERPKWPRLAIAFVVAGTLVSALAIVVLLNRSADDRAQAKKTRIAMVDALQRLEDAIEAAEIDIDHAQARMDAAFEDLESAITEEARSGARAARINAKAELAAKRAELRRLREKAAKFGKGKAKAKKRRNKREIDKCAKSNDPLCGL